MKTAPDKRVSIVIPAYNRPRKLQRALEYYAQYDVPVLVADGSPEPYSGALGENVEYFHIPSVLICERIYRVLCEVKTEYACFAADDDFVWPPFLEKAADLFDADPSVSTVFGRCYTFEEMNPREWSLREPQAHAIEDADPIERLRHFFGIYFSVFYAPTKTRFLREIFQEAAHFPTHYMNVVELMRDARIVTEGKIAYIDEFSNAREQAHVLTEERLEMTGPHAILAETPSFEKELDGILRKWMSWWEDGMFGRLVLTPWMEWHRRYEKPSIQLKRKLKLALSAILGVRLKRAIKRRVPYFSHIPEFEMEKCRDKAELARIRDLVLKTLA